MEDNTEMDNPRFEQRSNSPNQETPPEPPFNEDLAYRIAEDTQKLIQGKLGEDDYYHKYHKAYVNEFGIDNRPVLEDSPLNKLMSRRTLLKAGGVALAGMVGSRMLGGLGGSKALAAHGQIPGFNSKRLQAEEPPPPTNRVQKGMVIDLEKCTGCLSCVYACHHHNANPQGVLWLYVLAYKDENKEGLNYLVRPCMHCSNPPCVKVCPVRARHKRERDGLVLTDYNLCIGCRYCLVTCPYGVNYFQWDAPPPREHAITTYYDYRGRWVAGNPPKGCMGKCEFCPERQDDGRGTVVCQLSCPNGVIQFGDMNDPNSVPNRYLAKRKQESGGQLTTFRLLESHGTKPSVLYIGQEPSRFAQPVDGPVKYSDWGLAEKRLPYLGDYKPWFLKLVGGEL